jgi:hypothetical protein
VAERDLTEPREVTPFQMFDKGSNAAYGVTQDFRPRPVGAEEAEAIMKKATAPENEQLELFANDPVVAPSQQPDMAGAAKSGVSTGGAAKD